MGKSGQFRMMPKNLLIEGFYLENIEKLNEE